MAARSTRKPRDQRLYCVSAGGILVLIGLVLAAIF